MAVSFTTLQIYDQYLTTYRSRDYDSSNRKVTRRSSRYDTHDQSELQNVYSAIQWKNRFAPLYLNEPTPKSIAFAVHCNGRIRTRGDGRRNPCKLCARGREFCIAAD